MRRLLMKLFILPCWSIFSYLQLILISISLKQSCCIYKLPIRWHEYIWNKVPEVISMPICLEDVYEMRLKIRITYISEYLILRDILLDFLSSDLGSTITCILPLFTFYLYEVYRFIDSVNNLFLFYSILCRDVMRCDLNCHPVDSLITYEDGHMRETATLPKICNFLIRYYTIIYCQDHGFTCDHFVV